MNRSTHPTSRVASRAFTLTELLAAMGIIALLATITAFSVRAISRDSRLSSGTNTVTAVLGNARALAIRNNRPVMVLFRVKWDVNKPEARQMTELVLAQWTGETLNTGTPGSPSMLDRFVPVNGQQPRTLPPGIKVAAPWYDTGNDNVWITQTEMRALNVGEAPGRLFAVVYGPDGTLINQNPQTDAAEFYVDLDGDGAQDFSQSVAAAGAQPDWELNHPSDEVNINPAPFLAVYDDDAARENYDTMTWDVDVDMRADLSQYITLNANRLHFNRYTGVALTQRGAGG